MDRRVRVATDAAFPPAPGDRVATLVVTVPGLRIGAVPLVVASVAAPEPASGPWLVHGLEAFAGAAGDALAGLAD